MVNCFHQGNVGYFPTMIFPCKMYVLQEAFNRTHNQGQEKMSIPFKK